MPGDESALIDRRLAVAVASRFTGPQPTTTPDDRRAMGESIRELCAIAEDEVRAFTGWDVASGDTPEVVNRAAWVDANLTALEPLFARAADRLPIPGFARGPMRVGVSIQLGLLFAYLSRKVIAQFDLLGGERLLFVGPNIVSTEQRAGVDPRSFRLWVAIHEVTHRLQFGGVPWLRGALEDLIEQSLSMVSPVERSPADMVRRLRAALAHTSAVPALTETLLTEEQRALLRDAQVLMSAVEGHASFVMDRVGAKLIDDVAELRQRVEGARGKAPGPERTLQRVIGLEAKRRQYTDGKSFFDQIADGHGLDAVARAWSTREYLPTIEELADPDQWGSRVFGEG